MTTSSGSARCSASGCCTPTSRSTTLQESPHPRLGALLRRPYQAQADTITALGRAFTRHRGLFLVGELGTGKTLMAAGVMQVLFPRAFRALVMCPGHLVRKWRREILTTLPDVTVETIRSVADCLRLEARSGRWARWREVWLVSRPWPTSPPTASCKTGWRLT